MLVIDDEEIMLQSCRKILMCCGCEVDTEHDPFTGRDRALEGGYDLILLDLRMPNLSGMEILSAIQGHRSDLEVIIMTGYSTVDSAVKAMKLGAFDYVSKPFTPDELRERIEAALKYLKQRRFEAATAGTDVSRRKLLGDSEAMANVHALIGKIAPTDATVLIVGESGTGKEVAALEIHALSKHHDKSLVSLDCSALAPGLLESELFGHVKGSFTGAIATKPGLFEIADKGTLFLDEVSNLSMETQGKLLRVLETGEIKPVGGVDIKKVNIRLIAATNRDLDQMVKDGSFRQDLYYRLNVIPIRIPPLRERPSDISLLLDHFLGKYRSPNVRGPRRMSSNALELLTHYAWPGNVRELKNLVERLVVTTEGDTIRVEHLPDYIAQRTPVEEPRVPRTNEELKALKKRMRERMDYQFERAFVIEALRRKDWNISRAARETGMQRPNFHALMRKYGIRTADLKE